MAIHQLLPYATAGILWAGYGIFVKESAEVYVVNLIGACQAQRCRQLQCSRCHRCHSRRPRRPAASAGLLFVAGYLFVFYRWTASAHARQKLLALLGGIIVGSLLLFGVLFGTAWGAEMPMERRGVVVALLACAFNIVMLGSPIQSLVYAVKHLDTSRVPVAMVVVSLFCCISWSSFGLLLEDYFIFSPNFIGLLLAIVQLGTLWWIRRKQQRSAKLDDAPGKAEFTNATATDDAHGAGATTTGAGAIGGGVELPDAAAFAQDARARRAGASATDAAGLLRSRGAAAGGGLADDVDAVVDDSALQAVSGGDAPGVSIRVRAPRDADADEASGSADGASGSQALKRRAGSMPSARIMMASTPGGTATGKVAGGTDNAVSLQQQVSAGLGLTGKGSDARGSMTPAVVTPSVGAAAAASGTLDAAAAAIARTVSGRGTAKDRAASLSDAVGAVVSGIARSISGTGGGVSGGGSAGGSSGGGGGRASRSVSGSGSIAEDAGASNIARRTSARYSEVGAAAASGGGGLYPVPSVESLRASDDEADEAAGHAGDAAEEGGPGGEEDAVGLP